MDEYPNTPVRILLLPHCVCVCRLSLGILWKGDSSSHCIRDEVRACNLRFARN